MFLESKNTVALNLMLQYYRQKNITEPDSDELGNILNQENLIMEQVNQSHQIINFKSHSREKCRPPLEVRTVLLKNRIIKLVS